MLYKESGLLGISGLSNDMRDLLASAEPAARLAVDYFVYQATKQIGALAAVLGGVDALVYTGGIGENSPQIRGRLSAASAWLGMDLDPAANDSGGPCLTRPGSRVSCWVIPTDEELMIARHTSAVLGLD
jgi:acetate kinase